MLFFAWMIGLGMATPILKPQMSSEERYSESYTLSADLSDGSFVLFQVLFFNFGFGLIPKSMFCGPCIHYFRKLFVVASGCFLGRVHRGVQIATEKKSVP